MTEQYYGCQMIQSEFTFVWNYLEFKSHKYIVFSWLFIAFTSKYSSTQVLKSVNPNFRIHLHQ